MCRDHFQYRPRAGNIQLWHVLQWPVEDWTPCIIFHLFISVWLFKSFPADGARHYSVHKSLGQEFVSTMKIKAVPPLLNGRPSTLKQGNNCIALKKKYWSIVDLECFDSFWCTAKWFSHIYYFSYVYIYIYIYIWNIYIYSFSYSFP